MNCLRNIRSNQVISIKITKSSSITYDRTALVSDPGYSFIRTAIVHHLPKMVVAGLSRNVACEHATYSKKSQDLPLTHSGEGTGEPLLERFAEDGHGGGLT